MTYYWIYKITNLLNGKMYIGQHTTDNLDDGYMGSGIHIERAVKKLKPFTEEHKKRLSESRKKWWEEKRNKVNIP